VGAVYSKNHNIDLVPGKPVQIESRALMEEDENEWFFTSPPGTKIVSKCNIRTYSCDRLVVKVHDGATTRTYCGFDHSHTFDNSIGNRMSINVWTKGNPSVTFTCKLEATKPYLHIPTPEVDSSEHGVVAGKKPTSCDCGWANKEGQRIVGGKDTEMNEYPFPAVITAGPRKINICGGSIISPYHVLTAAHCTWELKGTPLTVVLGEHDMRTWQENPNHQFIEVDQVIEHDQYNNVSKTNDIAILVLKEKIVFNKAVGPVCLPSKSVNLQDQVVKVMGWGNVAYRGEISPVIKKANIRVIDLDICRTMYDLNKETNQICTYEHGRDSCQGDSGGPVVWLDPETNRYTQVGVISYGRACGSTDPAVNTDVASFKDWIEKVTKETHPDSATCKA